MITHITQWEFVRQLWPTLACRRCWQNSDPPGHTDYRRDWEVILKFGAYVEASCSCSAWRTSHPSTMTSWLGKRFVPFKDAVTMLDPETPVVTQRSEPLTDDEAALLEAWKHVMDACQWSEALQCNACFASANKTGVMADSAVRGYVLPGRSIHLNCDCTRREWSAKDLHG